MPGSLDSRLAIIRTLIDAAPDAVVRNLDVALSADPCEGAMAEIRKIVSAEAGERRTRSMTFGPILPLCPRQATQRHDCFPASTVAQLWQALKADMPEEAAMAMVASAVWSTGTVDIIVFDRLAVRAAEALRAPAGTPFAAVAAMLEAHREGAAERLAAYIDLIPQSRHALEQLPDWLGRMTDERAASVRLAFRDAVALSPDAGPLFMDLLLAQMNDPWEVLRVVSALMDRPSDDYLAGSELAHIGERLLDEVDTRLHDLGEFDPQAGPAAGAAAAEDARVVVMILSEFDHALDIKREGLWGGRIVKQKKRLAQIAEFRLGKVEEAVDGALPLKAVRIAGRLTRGVPKLAADPEEKLVTKARGFLAFLDGARVSAPTGGYAALRAKVVEHLEERLDHYAEDLIEELRNADSDLHDRARLYLDLCADFVGYVRDEKAAQIVRRRAAA